MIEIIQYTYKYVVITIIHKQNDYVFGHIKDYQKHIGISFFFFSIRLPHAVYFHVSTMLSLK